MTPLVLYHANCYDGACAAWAALRRHPDAEARPVSYGAPPPLEDARGRDVHVVDFSYPTEELVALAGAADRLVVVDHHRTGRARLVGLMQGLSGDDPGEACDFYAELDRRRVVVKFDIDRSGAGLTWDLLHPGEPRPWFVDYVEDRDLWRWDLEASNVVNAFISSYPPHPSIFDDLATLDPCASGSTVLLQGRAILRYRDRLVERLCERPDTALIGGHLVPVINTPVLASEACNNLAEGQPFAAAWSERGGTRTYQLRSAEGGVDVSEVAQRYGGGGHRHAAGYKVDAGHDDLHWIIRPGEVGSVDRLEPGEAVSFEIPLECVARRVWDADGNLVLEKGNWDEEGAP